MRTCPYTGSNAISLAYCALYTAIPLVHVPGFRCQADAMQARLGRLHIDESRWININLTAVGVFRRLPGCVLANTVS